MSITSTISVLELIWTLMASIGFLFTTRLVYRSWEDHQWLVHTNANGDFGLRKQVAMTSLLIFVGGLITQTSYLAVGILAMTIPSHTSHITHAQQVASGIFIFASLTGTVFAWVIYDRRIAAVKQIIEEREHHA